MEKRVSCLSNKQSQLYHNFLNAWHKLLLDFLLMLKQLFLFASAQVNLKDWSKAQLNNKTLNTLFGINFLFFLLSAPVCLKHKWMIFNFLKTIPMILE